MWCSAVECVVRRTKRKSGISFPRAPAPLCSSPRQLVFCGSRGQNPGKGFTFLAAGGAAQARLSAARGRGGPRSAGLGWAGRGRCCGCGLHGPAETETAPGNRPKAASPRREKREETPNNRKESPEGEQKLCLSNDKQTAHGKRHVLRTLLKALPTHQVLV